MLSFECDYNNGAHPKVLQHLIDTNSLTSLTYGFDEWSESARRKIREACGCPDADVYFLSGGTQANATVIDSLLTTCEAVISADTGHINVHEAGAVEASGHRVIGLPSTNGKLLPDTLQEFLQVYESDESRDHVAQPGMVYITYPTEMGTLYTAEEISQIQALCRRYDLQLFVDGARLGYGLMSPASDISLSWLARHCDAFYIGGTKVGALCGEAVVFPKGAPDHFFTMVKQHGALLAKGRVLGVQFDVLFTDDLYFKIAKNAIDLAMQLKAMFLGKGYELYIDSPTNQQFILLTPEAMKALEGKVAYEVWDKLADGRAITRFATSWASTPEQLAALESLLPRVK